MGAINNAFNQAAGAVAGAALAYQHAKESDFSKMNVADHSALIARNQASAATAEEDEATSGAFKEGGLVDQLRDATDAEEKATEAYEKAKNRKNGSRITRFKKMNELLAAQNAAAELRNKYKALEDLRDRAKEQRIYADKMTKIASYEKAKYEKRWGGIR